MELRPSCPHYVFWEGPFHWKKNASLQAGVNFSIHFHPKLFRFIHSNSANQCENKGFPSEDDCNFLHTPGPSYPQYCRCTLYQIWDSLCKLPINNVMNDKTSKLSLFRVSLEAAQTINQSKHHTNTAITSQVQLWPRRSSVAFLCCSPKSCGAKHHAEPIAPILWNLEKTTGMSTWL